MMYLKHNLGGYTAVVTFLVLMPPPVCSRDTAEGGTGCTRYLFSSAYCIYMIYCYCAGVGILSSWRSFRTLSSSLVRRQQRIDPRTRRALIHACCYVEVVKPPGFCWALIQACYLRWVIKTASVCLSPTLSLQQAPSSSRCGARRTHKYTNTYNINRQTLLQTASNLQSQHQQEENCFIKKSVCYSPRTPGRREPTSQDQ